MGFREITAASRRPLLQVDGPVCDTHMHFYNARYPTAPTALMTPPDAWVEDYRAVQAHLGLSRVVVVQPTTYGLDNTCQIEAMAAFGEAARGVFVVDEGVTDETLDEMTSLGGRGARFHLIPGGAIGWESLEPVAARIAPFGWHIQLQLNGCELPDHVDRLHRLPCPLVVDHIGRFTPPVEPDHDAFRALLGLLDTGRCWVKLSAPYKSFGDGERVYAETDREAAALIDAAPERMLWATNWPHPGKDWLPDDAEHMDLMLNWTAAAAVRRRILVDNPHELYGF